jgi:XTP/dITP diphosphohydrolase
MDQQTWLDAFARLKVIMDELRAACPWDRKQTIHSLRQLTIEETYELADAISGSDWKGIKEELGDLLLHILFYSKIGEEQQQFTLSEMITGICDKLVARHPHIYGDVQVKDEEEVKQNWEKLKLKEGKDSVLSGVPRSLPALVKAMRLQEKAKQVGFEWDNRSQVWNKVEEEMAELKEAVAHAEQSGESEQAREKMAGELGDLIFSLVNYARFLHVDAEHALEITNRKFISRFNRMEAIARQRGLSLPDMNLTEMDDIWNEIKKEDRDC